jgi:hypothetical protein
MLGRKSPSFMEKAEIQQQASEAIDKAKALIVDPATPSSHKSVLAIILGVVLKFLPVIIDIFHHATSAPVVPPIVNNEPAAPLANQVADQGAQAGAGDTSSADKGAGL